ncbi:histidinol-phosphatase HisJ family protein [Clostridiaceae bacterium OttesenSCG-928-D20]|nr:histidinol-phosphatase HisJ family protein [Clostridiaceae bacterium OttesenSCG-928-D20]
MIDFHIHSDCSMDGTASMLEMARAAKDRGTSHICFTDHIDMDHYMTGEINKEALDNIPEMRRQFTELKAKLGKDMQLFLGTEIGSTNHFPDWGREASEALDFDFILGSIHKIQGEPDFYFLKYKSEQHCRSLLDRYLDELIDLSRLDYIDVISHIGYAKRYMYDAGFKAKVEDDYFKDKLDMLLKTIIESGKGIEINCSGYLHPQIQGSIPEKSVLKRYKELGGEIITIGSDAHSVKTASLGLKEGYSALLDAGFRYVTIYRKRKPEFIKIS